MSGFNRVVLMGHLTRDPEVRKVGSAGTVVADLAMGMSERYKTRDGESTERSCFVNVVVWGPQAQACGKFLKKGRAAVVEGRLQYDQWETDKGESRNKLRVRADRVHFVSGESSPEAATPKAEGPAATMPS